MTTITPEQCQAITQAGDAPVQLLDPETNARYYLIKADPQEETEPESVASMYPLIADLDPGDWEDASEYGL